MQVAVINLTETTNENFIIDIDSQEKREKGIRTQKVVIKSQGMKAKEQKEVKKKLKHQKN